MKCVCVHSLHMIPGRALPCMSRTGILGENKDTFLCKKIAGSLGPTRVGPNRVLHSVEVKFNDIAISVSSCFIILNIQKTDQTEKWESLNSIQWNVTIKHLRFLVFLFFAMHNSEHFCRISLLIVHFSYVCILILHFI